MKRRFYFSRNNRLNLRPLESFVKINFNLIELKRVVRLYRFITSDIQFSTFEELRLEGGKGEGKKEEEKEEGESDKMIKFVLTQFS